jgi:uncharacterized protein YgiB involved in biofilm formation
VAGMSQGVKPQFGNRNGGAPGRSPDPAAAAKASSSAGSYSMTAMLDEQSRQRTLMVVMAVGLCAMLGWVYFNLFSEESIDGKILTSTQECASFGSASIEDCTDLWNRAVKLHADTAPSYLKIEQCEQVHGAGRCRLAERSTIATRQTKFIPNMAAFMVERAPSGDISLSPLYRDPKDGPDQWRKVGPATAKS